MFIWEYYRDIKHGFSDILLNGGTWFHFSTFIKILLAFIIIVIMNGSMMFCITSFFKSHHAFSTAMTLVGTLIGFMTGIYIPIGSLPVSLQWVIKLFPTSHGAVLLRQIMMETSLLETFQNIPHSFLEHFKESFGIVYSFGQVRLTPLFHIIYLFIFTIFLHLYCNLFTFISYTLISSKANTNASQTHYQIKFFS